MTTSLVDEKKEEPYSIFTRFQKVYMISIVINAILITGLSVYLYYPALNPIQKDLDTTLENVNLTITVYMIFQGISPSFWGPIADRLGRRPIYLLTITIFMASCVGLALAPNYGVLLTMRMLQAFGSSSALATGMVIYISYLSINGSNNEAKPITVAGTISDISIPSERGSYFGAMGGAIQISPVAGPVLGGVIAKYLSWRWVFWILLLFGACVWVLIFFLVPETLRSLVGNGSHYANPTPMQWWRYHYGRRHGGASSSRKEPSHGQKKRSINPLQPLLYLLERDVATGLVFRGLHFGVLHSYMTSTASFFGEWYGLDPIHVGLCYMPLGAGTILGAIVQGRLLDWDFRVIARAYYGKKSSSSSTNKDEDDQEEEAMKVMKAQYVPVDFPIYKARLRTSFMQSTTMQVVTLVYGWGLERKWPLEGILALQFLVGFAATSLVNVYQTLLVDLFPNDSSSITATNNLVRCLLGAAAVSIIEPGIRALGPGWMFTTLGLVLVVSNVLPAILLTFGPQWRKNRMDRENAAALQEDAS